MLVSESETVFKFNSGSAVSPVPAVRSDLRKLDR